MLERASSYEAPPVKRRVEGSVETIPIVGALTKRPDFWAMFFGDGNATYESLRGQLALAAEDPRIKSVVLAIDSPGGEVDGLFEFLDAIAAYSKPITALVDNAFSAAYAIAAATNKIVASGRGSSVGSLGVAVSYRLSDEVVTLTNTDSPNKRPDLGTDAGKAVVVDYLDQTADLFFGAIARGRKTTDAKIRKDYGRGASFTAENALDRGMIDSIQSHSKGAPKGNMTAEQIAALQAELDAARAQAAAAVARETGLATQVATLTSQVAALVDDSTKSALTSFVDQLQQSGKLPPSLRAWALMQTRASLETYAAAAPVAAAVTASAERVEAIEAVASTAMTAEEKAVCEQLGLSTKDFIAERNRLAQAAADRRAGVVN